MSQYSVLKADLEAQVSPDILSSGHVAFARKQPVASFDLDPDPAKWLEDSKSPGVNHRRKQKVEPSELETEESLPISARFPGIGGDSAAAVNTVDHPDLVVKKSEDDQGEISVAAELTRFAKLSAPNTIVMFFMYLQWTATLSVAAKYLGTEEMSGVSLASLTANLSGLTVVYGLLSAVDTLAPQSFGAGNMAEVGILVQRGILAVFSTFVITVIIWYNAEDILIGLGQPRNESRFAAIFLRYHFLSVPALALWESSRRFMWSQDVTQWPFVIIAVLSLGVHLVSLTILLPLLGFIGTPISHVITTWSMIIGVALWIRIKRPHNPETWEVNRVVVMNPQAMKTFLKLAIPGILSMSEWVFFEFFIFLSGTLGPTELAANSVAYTLIPISFTIPSGLSIATTARVGALLAQGRVKSAKALTRAVGMVTIALASIVFVTTFFGREVIIGAFSSDRAVQELARSIWLYLCSLLVHTLNYVWNRDD
jgi:MATE family multidrug resistance protein